MKRLVTLLFGAALTMTGCYNPELAPSPFLCGPGGSCPDGYSCYGGICMDSMPECMQPGWVIDGTAGEDLEPNNYPDIAQTLPCGASPGTPEYSCSCPPIPTKPGYRRATISNGIPLAAICPAGDNDFYKFWLIQGEELEVTLNYQYNVGRDLDIEIWRPNAEGALEKVGEAKSTNDNDSLTVSATVSGYYYILVLPKDAKDQFGPNGTLRRPADINEYILSFRLNPPGCNSNGTCDPYETIESCSADCNTDNICGNYICEQGETAATCPTDCVCGNGVCDLTETPDMCPDDCRGCGQ